jgi:hypothetical protein
MNAKKLLSVLVLAGAGLGLVACGTTSSSSSSGAATKTDRQLAIEALDKIATNVSAASFAKPTTLKAVGTVKTTEYDGAAVFAHTTYTADVKDKNGAVTTASGTEVWAYKGTDTKVYVVMKVGTVITSWSADADTTAFAPAATIAKAVSGSNGLGSAANMAKYLSHFPEGTTKVAAGATISEGTFMKAESYTIGTEGNVVLDITPNYTKTGYSYDEHMIYTYKSNLLASLDKSGLTTYTWSATVAATLPTDVGTAVANEAAGADILKLL